MKTSYLLGAVLSGALAATPVMAEDSAAFHALSKMPSGLSAMPEAQLASIEGGTPKTNTCVSSSAGGLLTLIPVNALNCSNVAVVVPINACVAAIVGVCAGAQTNSVDLSQVVQGIF